MIEKKEHNHPDGKKCSSAQQRAGRFVLLGDIFQLFQYLFVFIYLNRFPDGFFTRREGAAAAAPVHRTSLKTKKQGTMAIAITIVCRATASIDQYASAAGSETIIKRWPIIWQIKKAPAVSGTW